MSKDVEEGPITDFKLPHNKKILVTTTPRNNKGSKNRVVDLKYRSHVFHILGVDAKAVPNLTLSHDLNRNGHEKR